MTDLQKLKNHKAVSPEHGVPYPAALMIKAIIPSERLWLFIMLCDEDVDGALEVDNGVEDPALKAALGQLAKKTSTALSYEHDVGVKREWRSSQARTLACLWTA